MSGAWSPSGDVLLVSMDRGGSEFYQLYTLKDGRLTLLTDGKSRNDFGAWSKDGRLVGYSSTRRNGTDSDLYVIDPRDPRSDRLVAQVKGGGWGIAAFMPGGREAIVADSQSITKVNLYRLDLQSGAMRPIGDHRREIAYYQTKVAPDGRCGFSATRAATSSGSARSTSQRAGSRREARRSTGTSRSSRSATTGARLPSSPTKPGSAGSIFWTSRAARCGGSTAFRRASPATWSSLRGERSA